MRRSLFIAFTVFSFILISCGDTDKETDPISDCDLSGTWNYTQQNGAGGTMTMDKTGVITAMTISTCPGASIVSSTVENNTTGQDYYRIDYTVKCDGESYRYAIFVQAADCDSLEGYQAWDFDGGGKESISLQRNTSS